MNSRARARVAQRRSWRGSTPLRRRCSSSAATAARTCARWVVVGKEASALPARPPVLALAILSVLNARSAGVISFSLFRRLMSYSRAPGLLRRCVSRYSGRNPLPPTHPCFPPLFLLTPRARCVITPLPQLAASGSASPGAQFYSLLYIGLYHEVRGKRRRMKDGCQASSPHLPEPQHSQSPHRGRAYYRGRLA